MIMVVFTILTFIPPLIALTAGYLMRFHPPKNRRGMNGYRTRRSRKSQEAWDYSQKLCGKYWLILFPVLTAVSIAVMLINMNRSDEVIELISICTASLEILAMVLTIIPIENKLKEKFGR